MKIGKSSWRLLAEWLKSQGSIASRGADQPAQRIAIVATAACAVAYVATFLATCREADSTSAWLTTVPAITAGWTWGLRGGLVVGLLTLPVNAVLLCIAGLPGWELVTTLPGGIAQAIAPLAGALCGRLHELGQLLQGEREERREAERELQLTRRSLDATVRLLNNQADTAQQNWQAKTQAEEQVERSQRELQRVHLRLTRTALTDIETELPNRRVALERLQLEWAAAASKHRSLSGLVIRLDDPMRLRAMQGPQVADQVVRETLDILRESTRQADELFSLGGDEFFILCPNSDFTAAFECAERLRALVELNTVPIGETIHHVTVSVGIATNEPGVNGPEELLRGAQQALYDAQQIGRNKVAGFAPLESGLDERQAVAGWIR